MLPGADSFTIQQLYSEECTQSELCHNHIIIISNDVMSFIKYISGFLHESSSAVPHLVCHLIDGVQ